MKRFFGLIAINIIVIMTISMLTPYFFSKNNFVVLLDNIAIEAIVLAGYTLLLISGNFDLSVDGVVALTGVICGILMMSGVNWILAALFALCVAGTIGFFNGILTSKIGINGFIATLTTWWICIGITFGITKAIAPFDFPDNFQAIGQTKFFDLRFYVIYVMIVIIVLSIILYCTKLGAHIFLTGDNRQASEMMGIDTTRLGIMMYILVGILAGSVGIILASRLNAASPMAVDGMAMRVIAASMIGGTSLSGGKGSIVNSLLGLFLMSILSNAVIHLGISPYWQKGILGGILLFAVLIEKLRSLK
jgi:ribose transport system permease protein